MKVATLLLICCVFSFGSCWEKGRDFLLAFYKEGKKYDEIKKFPTEACMGSDFDVSILNFKQGLASGNYNLLASVGEGFTKSNLFSSCGLETFISTVYKDIEIRFNDMMKMIGIIFDVEKILVRQYKEDEQTGANLGKSGGEIVQKILEIEITPSESIPVSEL